MTEIPSLFFGRGNAKLNKSIATFSLPAGHFCPFASDCLSKANRKTGKIIDGKNISFRCFAASQEALLPSVRKSRWGNLDALRGRTKAEMIEILLAHLPRWAKLVRVHVSGDFFSQDYFDAWLEVARQNPAQIFYAYTKSLPYWVARKNEIPNNFKLAASVGGKADRLILEHGLRYAEVVYSYEEAAQKGLEIDHDDSHLFDSNKSFALLIHGTQPKGEKARHLSALKKLGFTGYSNKKTA